MRSGPASFFIALLAQSTVSQPCRSTSHSIPSFAPYTAQCQRDGSFAPLQCHSETGLCWCVQPSGQIVPNTMTPARSPTPDCEAVVEALTVPSFCCMAIAMCGGNQQPSPMPCTEQEKQDGTCQELEVCCSYTVCRSQSIPESQQGQTHLLGGGRDDHGCIGSAGYTWCESSQKCLRVWEEDCTDDAPNDPMPLRVGGDQDDHGCIGSAGYTWCESSQKCLRVWEEDCTDDDPNNQCKESQVWDECNSPCAPTCTHPEEPESCIEMCVAGCGCPNGGLLHDEGCAATVEDCPSNAAIRLRVGGDQDNHGCIGSAGYTWCESSQKCLRAWEEGCLSEQPGSAVVLPAAAVVAAGVLLAFGVVTRQKRMRHSKQAALSYGEML